jgi:chromodomain-helicase-DNA-binding protein 1
MIPNGDHSPKADNNENGDHAASDSESDLSDLADRPLPPQLSSSPLKSHDVDDNTSFQRRSSETLDHGDGMGSDDGDYEMDTTLPDHNAEQSDHSDSSHSTRAPKRKAPVEEEEEIYNNPELYGLRRSGRARPSRNVIESSEDEQDQDSDSDVVSHRRKRRKPTVSQKSSKRATPIIRSPSDSESGSDTYGGARARVSKKHRRRMLQESNLAPAHAEIRFSTRRSNKVSSYNEDDDEEEDESEIVTPGYWANAAEDNTPAIETVLDHRLREGVEEKYPDLHKEHFEFYVKWQGKSHYHASWEISETLSTYRSYRRLENYCRKTLSEDLRIHNDPDVAPEEKEKWLLDRERETDALDDYKKVERVIDAEEGEGGTVYYVKWKGLVYEYCTWESGALVSTLAQTEIDRYLDRSHRQVVSNKSETNPQTRRKFERIGVQPDYVKNGTLRDFQVKGLNFLAYNWVKGNNVILADEMGLGKTVQTVAFMNWLRHDRGQQGPFIVVAPLSTIPSWAETLDHWTPDMNYVVYNGKEKSRDIIKRYELLVDGDVRQPKFNLLLTTYEYVLMDAAFLSQLKWQFLAVDEAHRLKNRESQLYGKLMEFKAPCRLLITGTPIQNNLSELSSLMDFLMPGMVEIEENMDLTSEAASKKIAELTNAIHPYMLRRTKSKVESDLPGKTEKIIRVELSDVQLEYYKNILTKNYTALNQGAKGPKQSLLNVMMELKKASNHPFMFPNAEDRILAGSNGRSDDYLRALITSSGKMMLLDQLLTKLKKDGHRVLIFSQMVKMLDILQDYLGRRGYQYQRLDGTINSATRRMAIDHFNAPGSNDFCFLLSTRAGGLGINLMTADTVVLFDSDWNPQADLQAMARAHRIGQLKPVSVYRLVSKETVEEEILERARNKLMLEFVTIQRGVTDKEAQEIGDKFARAGRVAHEPTSSEDISRILKRRGQKMFEQSGNQKKLEELDIDSVLANAEEHQTEQPDGLEADGGEEFLKNFEYVDVQVDLEWDDIIPKDQLEEIKRKEAEREHAKYLAQVIEQNAPRKRKAPQDESREERNAKRQQRVQELDDASDEGANVDPHKPLNEKEHRHLIRAFLRYGSIDDRTEELVKEARLVGRDLDLLKSTLQTIIDKAKQLIREDEVRVQTLERESNKTLTKKDKKAVLFDYSGVKRLNAVTIVERAGEMRMLAERVSSMPDPLNFRISGATKVASYSCEWGPQEDGRLMVGQAKYGFGAWQQIRDDPELNMHDKLFLEEHRVDKKEERKAVGGDDKNAKSPGAVHLVRRSDYLLSVLKDITSGGANPDIKKTVENHHRNNKKHERVRRQENGQSVSASPAPSSARRQSDKHRRGPSLGNHRDSVERRTSHGDHTPKPEARHDKHRRTEDHSHHRHKSGEKASEKVGTPNGSVGDDKVVKLLFKPVREALRNIQSATKEGVPDKKERARKIRVEFRKIGQFIKDQLDDEEGSSSPGNDRSSLEPRLWWVLYCVSKQELFANIYH